MQDLTPVGLSKDGKQLVLVSVSGEEYAVPADARLRAALRGENAPHGQLEMKMDSALRPRDIQSRIRAGESPEDVATAAQTTVEGIMAFAGPVLAERAHVAQTAQRASLRRRSGEAGGARTLGDAADLFFAEHHLHDEDVEWDAWRRPDGRWALVATYAVDGRPARAEFTHDLPGRYVVAENDDARVLTGELRPPGAAPVSPAARRLATVRSSDDLPLGDDAIELVRDRDGSAADLADPVAVVDPVAATDPTGTPAEAATPVVDPDPEDAEQTRPQPALIEETEVDTSTVAGSEPAAELPPVTDAPPARAVPRGASAAADPVGMDPLPFDPGADTADADWLVAEDTALVERPGRRDHSAEPDAGSAEDTGDTGDARDRDRQEAKESKDPKESKAEARRKGRSSVPSWDEIMFGGGKND